jgi:hypothetical protein
MQLVWINCLTGNFRSPKLFYLDISRRVWLNAAQQNLGYKVGAVLIFMIHLH